MPSRSANRTHPEESHKIHLVNPSINKFILKPLTPFTKLKEITHLKSILVSLILYTWDQSGCLSLNLFQLLNILFYSAVPRTAHSTPSVV